MACLALISLRTLQFPVEAARLALPQNDFGRNFPNSRRSGDSLACRRSGVDNRDKRRRHERIQGLGLL